MPIFDYSCKACGHTFDVLQKLGADALTDCPECGQPELKKLLSAPAFHLKGKGWRNSDDSPKKPEVRPKFAHTFDSPTPHAEHGAPKPAKQDHAHDNDHSHGHDHGHSHDAAKVQDSGVGKIVRDHVHSQQKSDGHSHGHGHSHDHSHKHDD